LSAAPYFLGAAGPIYLVSSIVLGGLFVAAAIAVLRDRTDRSAKRMFGYSILYLFLLFGVLMIDAGPGLIARLGA
jgi:protoheme IX farnesyltransferase